MYTTQLGAEASAGSTIGSIVSGLTDIITATRRASLSDEAFVRTQGNARDIPGSTTTTSTTATAAAVGTPWVPFAVVGGVVVVGGLILALVLRKRR
jgi:hypothetical protein